MTVRGGLRFIPYVITAALAVAIVYGIVWYAVKEIGPDHRYRVYVYFRDADGLRPDSDVKIGGVPGGQLTNLQVINYKLAKATVLLNSSAAPLGQGASAAVRPVNLLGEKYIDLNPGNLKRPLPSGSSIPASRTNSPVELDDILNILQPDVRARLGILIDEFGVAMDGRGTDFNQLLRALPPSLDQARQLVASFAADNQQLKTLITEGDQDLSAFNGSQSSLNSLVVSAANALSVTAAKRQQLAATIGQAPSALAQLRTTLSQLQGTASQLAPAADELRATAPSLTETLDRLPAFAAAAEPTLQTARRVAPALTRLGNQGTPPLTRLTGTLQQLQTFATKLNPLTAGLNRQIMPLLSVIEGWARTIAASDNIGHLFRTQATVDKYLVTDVISRYQALLTNSLGGMLKPAAASSAAKAAGPAKPAAQVAAPPAAQASPPSHSAPPHSGGASGLSGLIGGLLPGTQAGGAGSSQGSSGTGGQGVGQTIKSLLGYLLGP